MSDHLSGPRGLLDPACDICDSFAFPSPERPGHVVLAMTLFPFAGPTAVFSDAVQARWRLRPVASAGQGSAASFDVGGVAEEIMLDVTFKAPASQSVPPQRKVQATQRGRCVAPDGEIVAVTVGKRGGREGAGLRVFAGLASDPFMIDGPSIMKTLATGKMALKDESVNTLLGANVLAIVVEFDCARWLGGETLFGVVAETLAVGKRPIRLERVGRPEIKNVGLQWNGYDMVNRNIDIRDLYNDEDAFAVAKTYLGAYRTRLNANLGFYDGLDGKVDWPLNADGNHPLTDLLLEDFLVVDVSKPFAVDSYFEIEQAMLDGREHQTCGGRWLNDDVLDTLYTLVINAGNEPRIRDGVDEATVPASHVFPYLAPPNPPKPG